MTTIKSGPLRKHRRAKHSRHGVDSMVPKMSETATKMLMRKTTQNPSLEHVEKFCRVKRSGIKF
jgi:hypothetical protein